MQDSKNVKPHNNIDIMLREILTTYYNHSILSIEGPVGCGKTRSMISFLLGNSTADFLGQHILLIQPTAMAISRAEQMKKKIMRGEHHRNVSILNARLAFHTLLDTYQSNTEEPIDTVVVDEAQFHSLDYEALLRLLSFLHREWALTPRIYFLSSNLDRSKMQMLFPSIYFAPNICCLPRFPVQIQYREWFSKTPFTQASLLMREYITSMLVEEYPLKHPRIIVFLASHHHCEQYKSYLEDIYGIKDCILYHGGQKRHVLPWDSSQRFILLTTNIMESALPLPDVSLIVDLGVYYHKMPNGVVSLQWCDQTMLDQRAGKTGRTGPGTVVRAFHRSLLKHLCYRTEMEYSWEWVIIDLMTRGLDPSVVLGSALINPSLNRLQMHGLLKSARILHFAKQSDLEPECAVMMYRFMKSGKKVLENEKAGRLLILLTILLLHLVRTQNKSFFCSYPPPSKRGIVFERDEVCILLSFFLSLYCSSSSCTDRLLEIYPLDKKTFDMWKQRCYAFFQQFPETKTHVLELSQVPNTFMTRVSPNKNKNVQLYDLGPHRESLSRFFFHQTTLEITRSHATRKVMDRECFDSRMFSKVYTVLPNRPFLVLHWKHLEQLPTPVVSLFLFPHHWKFSVHVHLMEALREHVLYQADKEITRYKKKPFLDDIRDIVAHHPYNHGMMQTMEEWKQQIIIWNASR